MNRRKYMTVACGAGVTALAGCTGIAGSKTLSEPEVETGPSGRTTLSFTDGGSEVGHLSVTGRVSGDRVRLSTEIWHREQTRLESITLRVWMPEAVTDSPAEVAVVSPVEGDSSPPPSLSLSTPEQSVGTTIEVSDLDDLADETVDTLSLLVLPRSEAATDVKIHATIELSSSKTLGTDYTLDGELGVSYPDLATE